MGPKRKNPTTSPPYSAPPLEIKDKSKSNSEKVRSENVFEEKVDATPIDLQYPLLDLIPSFVTIIELWGYPGIQVRYNVSLSRVWNGKIKIKLYLERWLNNTKMEKLRRYEANFRQYVFYYMTRSSKRYSVVLVHEFYATYKGDLQR